MMEPQHNHPLNYEVPFLDTLEMRNSKAHLTFVCVREREKKIVGGMSVCVCVKNKRLGDRKSHIAGH